MAIELDACYADIGDKEGICHIGVNYPDAIDFYMTAGYVCRSRFPAYHMLKLYGQQGVDLFLHSIHAKCNLLDTSIDFDTFKLLTITLSAWSPDIKPLLTVPLFNHRTSSRPIPSYPILAQPSTKPLHPSPRKVFPLHLHNRRLSRRDKPPRMRLPLRIVDQPHRLLNRRLHLIKRLLQPHRPRPSISPKFQIYKLAMHPFPKT